MHYTNRHFTYLLTYKQMHAARRPQTGPITIQLSMECNERGIILASWYNDNKLQATQMSASEIRSPTRYVRVNRCWLRTPSANLMSSLARSVFCTHTVIISATDINTNINQFRLAILSSFIRYFTRVLVCWWWQFHWSFACLQWRRNWGFRRFNEPGPPSSWAPE